MSLLASVRTLMIWGIAAPILVLPGSVDAQELPTHDPWATTMYYFVNEDSFNTELNGLTMTDAQARYWIAWSLKQWVARGGVDFEFENAGDTNLGPVTSGDSWEECTQKQDRSFVAVLEDCIDDGCDLSAAVRSFYEYGFKYQAQLCIWGNANNYGIDADTLQTFEMDIVSLLVHELGHAVGMNHATGGAMVTVGVGDTSGRNLTSTNVEHIQGLYGTASRQLRAAEFQGSSFNYVTVSTSAVNMRYGATIAEDTNDDLIVVRSTPQSSGTAINFTTTDYPVTSSSTWANHVLNASTWHAPNLVANLNYILAAWPGTTSSNGDCGGITVGRTGDVFGSMSLVSFPNDCTKHEVSVAFDPTTTSWILAYTRYKNNDQAGGNDRIMMRVSDDGLTWSAAEDMGIRSSSAPAIACSDEECILVYNHRSANATPHTRSFTVEVNGSGNATGVDLSSSYTNRGVVALSPPGAGGRVSSPDVLVSYSFGEDHQVNFSPSSGSPAPFTTEYDVTHSALYGGTIAAFNRGSASPKPYLFYVAP